MACRYTYKGKTYEAHEFDDVLRAMPPSEAAQFMPTVQAVPLAPFVAKTEAWTALAIKRWRHPLSGLEVCFGKSTLERWYYQARHAADPVATLRNRLRGNIGRFPSMRPRTIEVLTTQYRRTPTTKSAIECQMRG